MDEKLLIPGGAYFVFEGPGKSGKSSTLEVVAGALSYIGYSVVTTREPGGPIEAENMRQEIFLLKSQGKLTPLQEIEMFYQARALSMLWVISQMQMGRIVIKDRDYVSTEVFQIETGAKQTVLESIHTRLFKEKKFPNPDLRLIILPKYETIESRRRGSMGDAYDELGEKMLKAFYAGYGEIAYDIVTKGSKCHLLLAGDTIVVNAIGSLEDVARKTVPHVLDTIDKIRVKYPNGRDF